MNAATTQENLQLLEAAPNTSHQLPLARANEAASLIQVIADAARDPHVDIEKMERLWAMHERMTNRTAEEAFNVAMNKAQGEMGRVGADANNSQTRSKYATYAKLDAALRPVYTGSGFSLSFDTGDDAPEAHVRVLAYVSHSGGHTRTYHCDMPSDGKGAKGGDVMTKTHASGSAMSYGMRYLLKLIFNVAVGEEDDDGNAASVTGAKATGSIVEKIVDGLLADLAKTITDQEAAALWSSGSKTLHATGNVAAYEDFKAMVIAHRTRLKKGGAK